MLLDFVNRFSFKLLARLESTYSLNEGDARILAVYGNWVANQLIFKNVETIKTVK